MNHLSDSTSPYLLQHAQNPVQWWPWCKEALQLAHDQDKPILLSIGYSACHWCHVMAHESFENEEIAELMNSMFVNIKVDREERPDLDRIYQLAHQAIAQRSGGWPLTMFLTADDQTPFFGGTYFPPEPRQGMPGFPDLLARVRLAWDNQRDQLAAQNQGMREFLTAAARTQPSDEALSLRIVDRAVEGLGRQFDRQQGGFGSAPKFPHPPSIGLLLAVAESDDHEQSGHALNMARVSLEKMALGGINDQIGGGFCRYSVDGMWMIPHFEKMAYDNAQLLVLYANAIAVQDERLFRDTLLATGNWVMRDLQAENGGYFSSWDADSEGEEGKFYLWDAEQVKSLLTADQWSVIAPHYGFDRSPNFEGHAWNPHVFKPVDELAIELQQDASAVRELVIEADKILLGERERRIAPGRDDKILTSWNGLMIEGMATAGRRLQHQAFVDSARSAVDFLRQHLWREGRLFAVHRQGRSHLNAYLDDYAFLLNGTLALLEADWRDQDLGFARDLADAMLSHFSDQENGGFFFTSHDHEQLIQRPKPLQDESVPAGNGSAAQGLIRLGHLLCDPAYLDAAEGILRAAWGEVQRVPHAYCTLLQALQDWQSPARQLVIRTTDNKPLTSLVELGLRDRVYRIPAGSSLEERYPLQGEFTAYLCSKTQCGPPISSLEELLTLI